MKKTTTTIKIKEESKPEKARPIGEFVIVAKFGGHLLCHLAFRLANVIWHSSYDIDLM